MVLIVLLPMCGERAPPPPMPSSLDTCCSRRRRPKTQRCIFATKTQHVSFMCAIFLMSHYQLFCAAFIHWISSTHQFICFVWSVGKLSNVSFKFKMMMVMRMMMMIMMVMKTMMMHQPSCNVWKLVSKIRPVTQSRPLILYTHSC